MKHLCWKDHLIKLFIVTDFTFANDSLGKLAFFKLGTSAHKLTYRNTNNSYIFYKLKRSIIDIVSRCFNELQRRQIWVIHEMNKQPFITRDLPDPFIFKAAGPMMRVCNLGRSNQSHIQKNTFKYGRFCITESCNTQSDSLQTGKI